jgi:hypothetical protein
MSGFQTAVNFQPGNAVAGDFASNNPRASVLAGPNGLVAGTGGINIGTFGWVQADGVTVLNSGTVAPSGFVDRPNNYSITTAYGGAPTFAVPEGFGVTLMNAGDFWAETTTAATIGQAIFASTTTGAIQTGTAGAVITGYVQTNFYVASAAAANTLVKISSRGV